MVQTSIFNIYIQNIFVKPLNFQDKIP